MTDLSRFPAEPELLAEAKKGLKGKMPPGLAWFPLDELPALTWRDGSERLPLGDVPPVLLAEVYSDYLAIANAFGRFDPDWASKAYKP